MFNPILQKKKNTRSVGSHYEHLAEQFLLRQGLRCLQRNYACSMGEIDLVMEENGTLVFVEVRYRKACGHGRAIETVSPAKQRKIIRTAQFFLENHRHYHQMPCRFDVVGIDQDNTATLTIDWVKNAFME